MQHKEFPYTEHPEKTVPDIHKDRSHSLPPIPCITGDYSLLNLKELYDKALDLHAHDRLSAVEFNQITKALNEVTELLEGKSHGSCIVRQARLSDVDSLYKMICYWAEVGENLPRPREDVIRSILTFAVCVRDGEVVGCASLYVYDSGLAEIRSLGVSPLIQRQGQGRAIVTFLIEKARQMAIEKVFALTRSPQFFAKVGFTPTTREALPEKILKDCEKCPKKHCCDEHAYEMNLK